MLTKLFLNDMIIKVFPNYSDLIKFKIFTMNNTSIANQGLRPRRSDFPVPIGSHALGFFKGRSFWMFCEECFATMDFDSDCYCPNVMPMCHFDDSEQIDVLVTPQSKRFNPQLFKYRYKLDNGVRVTTDSKIARCYINSIVNQLNSPDHIFISTQQGLFLSVADSICIYDFQETFYEQIGNGEFHADEAKTIEKHSDSKGVEKIVADVKDLSLDNNLKVVEREPLSINTSWSMMDTPDGPQPCVVFTQYAESIVPNYPYYREKLDNSICRFGVHNSTSSYYSKQVYSMYSLRHEDTIYKIVDPLPIGTTAINRIDYGALTFEYSPGVYPVLYVYCHNQSSGLFPPNDEELGLTVTSRYFLSATGTVAAPQTKIYRSPWNIHVYGLGPLDDGDPREVFDEQIGFEDFLNEKDFRDTTYSNKWVPNTIQTITDYNVHSVDVPTTYSMHLVGKPTIRLIPTINASSSAIIRICPQRVASLNALMAHPAAFDWNPAQGPVEFEIYDAYFDETLPDQFVKLHRFSYALIGGYINDNIAMTVYGNFANVRPYLQGVPEIVGVGAAIDEVYEEQIQDMPPQSKEYVLAESITIPAGTAYRVNPGLIPRFNNERIPTVVGTPTMKFVLRKSASNPNAVSIFHATSLSDTVNKFVTPGARQLKYILNNNNQEIELQTPYFANFLGDYNRACFVLDNVGLTTPQYAETTVIVDVYIKYDNCKIINTSYDSRLYSSGKMIV